MMNYSQILFQVHISSFAYDQKYKLTSNFTRQVDYHSNYELFETRFYINLILSIFFLAFDIIILMMF